MNISFQNTMYVQKSSSLVWSALLLVLHSSGEVWKSGVAISEYDPISSGDLSASWLSILVCAAPG